MSAWAKVEVTIDDNVEVYMGDEARISCLYSFTDVDAEPSDVIIQWFVVRTVKTDTGRLLRSQGLRAFHAFVHGSKQDKQTHSACQNANKKFTAWKEQHRHFYGLMLGFLAPKLMRAARQMEMSH